MSMYIVQRAVTFLLQNLEKCLDIIREKSWIIRGKRFMKMLFQIVGNLLTSSMRNRYTRIVEKKLKKFNICNYILQRSETINK